MTQHKQSHRIKWHDHHIKWHDMHQNRSHHHHGTAEGSFTAKKWFAHRAGRSPCAHSIGKFFLCYIVLFFFWNFRPRLARELLVFFYSTVLWLDYFSFTLLCFVSTILWLCCCLTLLLVFYATILWVYYSFILLFFDSTSSRTSPRRTFQKRRKNFTPKKEFTYRMCARRPTSAMPKPRFLCSACQPFAVPSGSGVSVLMVVEM